jgi:outer membrane protein assembly factor BamD
MIPYLTRGARQAVPLVCGALLLLSLGGCETLSSISPWSGKEEDLVKKADPTAQTAEQLYNAGIDALNQKRYQTAVQQFDNVEQNYPYSSWAVNAQLMHGYAEYLQNRYTEAIGALDRFIQLHPAHKDVAYAYYLRGLCYYEQIADISRDQKGTVDAMNALQEVVNHFPDSAYARDARLKIDLCRDHLAGKEMEIGRFYATNRQWIAALLRFRAVAEKYQTTSHTPEALYRMVEANLALGLPEEAARMAGVLAANYPGSKWYERSYRLVKAHPPA